MTPAAQQELYTLCGRFWRKIQTRLFKVRLQPIQWEDIQAVATARVFTQFDKFEAAKGTLHGWAFTIMWRSAQNSLRAIIPNLKINRDHKWRTNLLMARPLAVKTVEVGRWGEEVVVMLPDIIDDTSPQRDALEVQEFRGLLGRDERRILDMITAGTTLRNLARTFGYKDACGGKRLVRRLHNRWSRYRAGIEGEVITPFRARPAAARGGRTPKPRVDAPKPHDFLIAA